MKYAVYMVMNGQAKQAVEFYKDVLGGEIEAMQTFAEAPQNPDFPLPEGAEDRIIHAKLNVGDQFYMFSDTFPGQELKENNGNITITLTDINAEEAHAFGDKLKVNGKVIMEVQETFWSKAYGQIEDQFGVTWQINASK